MVIERLGNASCAGTRAVINPVADAAGPRPKLRLSMRSSLVGRLAGGNLLVRRMVSSPGGGSIGGRGGDAALNRHFGMAARPDRHGRPWLPLVTMAGQSTRTGSVACLPIGSPD